MCQLLRAQGSNVTYAPRTCELGQPGYIFGSGTISAPERSGWGSLSELSEDGRTQIALPSGEQRTFLQDGDELILRALAQREGYATIGFGDCAGVVTSAPALAQ